MGQRSTGLKGLAGGVFGGLTVAAVAAAIVMAIHPAPNLVDRALPELTFAVWILAWIAPEGVERDLGFLLTPLLLAISLAIPEVPLRLLLFGFVLGSAAVMYLWRASEEWSPAELFAAAVIVVPLRLVEFEPITALRELTFVIGAVVLWRMMRQRSGIALTAASVVLLCVSIPGSAIRLALVPWCLAGMVWLLGRERLLPNLVLAAIAAVVARWLAAAIIIVLVIDYWRSRAEEERGASRAIVPGAGVAVGNLRGLVLPLSFFPAAASTTRSLMMLAGVASLALVVRPSLTAAILSVGIVAACVRHENDGRVIGSPLGLPSVGLTFLVLLFFPWSGAIVALPPAPLPAIAVLSVAAILLLPTPLRSLTGLAACLLVGALVLQQPDVPFQSNQVGASLRAGETISIPLRAVEGSVEVGMAGANLADAAAGRTVATLEVLDAAGRGYSRTVEIGEIADWGAFRPGMVLGTWNPRPDRPWSFEGLGIESWVRGTGAVLLDPIVEPRWVVITADPGLAGKQRLIVEEIRYR